MERRWESATENKALEKAERSAEGDFHHSEIITLALFKRDNICRDHQIHWYNWKAWISFQPESLHLSCNIIIWGNQKLLPFMSTEHQRCKSTVSIESMGYSWLPCTPPALLGLLSFTASWTPQISGTLNKTSLALRVCMGGGTWGQWAKSIPACFPKTAAAMKGPQGHLFLSLYSLQQTTCSKDKSSGITSGPVQHL